MASGSGPHRLAWLCYEVVGLAVKRDIVHKLFTYPAECLPFMVFCLRKLYPTEAMFLQKAPATLRVWLESFHSIDFSERAHAQMRTDLSSDGCSKNFAAACNRLVVRQLIASHIDKGGVDVGTAPVAGVLCDENHVIINNNKRAGLGSSPFIVFHSIRMRTKKQLMAMGRNMTKNEIRQCEAEIKDEWAVIRDNEQEYELWRGMSLANRRPIHAGAAGGLPSADAHDGATCRQFKGLWSLSSSPKELIPLQVLADYEASEREKGQKRRDSESKEQASKLIVRGPVPQRKQFVVGGWGSLHGCADGMRNVCLQHGTGVLRRRLVENVTQMIRAWVGSLDLESKQDASQLVAFTGKEMTADGHTQTVMALLVLSFGSPVAQMFVNCGFVCLDLPALPRLFHRPACPFRVRILDRLGRMCLPGIGSDRRAFDFQTDVELASDLVSWQDGWDMHTTTYTICGGDTILDMLVSDMKLFEMPAKKKPTRRRTATSDLPAEFDMGDPFDLAWADGHGAGDLPRAGSAHDGDDGDDQVRSDGSEDDCLFRDDPGDDFAEDILEGLEEQHGLPGMEGEGDENQGEDEEDDQEEVEPPPEATEAELIAAAIAASDDSSDLGYIACPIFPWNFKQCIARITCWPMHLPEAQQSLACRCYMHPACSITRKRLAFPKEQYMKWIFSMKPLPHDATPAQKEAAKHEHLNIKGAEFLPKKQAAPAAA
jgi:hypothetical protein